MTSRSLLPFSVALAFCVHATAHAASLSAASSEAVSPASSLSTPVYSLGTISIAPSPQLFGPSATNSVPKKPSPSARHRSGSRSRRVLDPIPLRIYCRA